MNIHQKLIIAIVIIVIVILVLVALIVWYIQTANPYVTASYLKFFIDGHRIQQNKRDVQRHLDYFRKHNINITLENIPPSYCSAWVTAHSVARNLNDDLMLHFKQVQKEILNLCDEFEGLAMVDLDEIQRRSFFKTAANWKVLWVKFFDQWGPLADRMPTLKRIVEKHDKLVLLHISIMEPGTELPMHEGISPAVVRYHLPIQVPPGDNVFLNINGYKVNWEVGNGYVFDDCVRHGVMMKPRVNMKRIIIFADIPREFDGILGPFYETLCAFFHASIRNNTNVEEIKKRIVQHQNSEIIELEKSHS